MAYKLGKAGKAGKGSVAAAPKGGGKRSFESVADGTLLYCICVSVFCLLCVGGAAQWPSDKGKGKKGKGHAQAAVREVTGKCNKCGQQGHKASDCQGAA